MSRERAELSKKNPYHIPRYRYYELKYFCRQYDDWKKALTLIDGWQTSPNDISGIIKGCPTCKPDREDRTVKSVLLQLHRYRGQVYCGT